MRSGQDTKVSGSSLIPFLKACYVFNHSKMFRGVWVLSCEVKLGWAVCRDPRGLVLLAQTAALPPHVTYFQTGLLDSHIPLQKLLLTYIPVLSFALV